jgi:hypothetical protein
MSDNTGVPVEKLLEVIGRQTVTIQLLNERIDALLGEINNLKGLRVVNQNEDKES